MSEMVIPGVASTLNDDGDFLIQGLNDNSFSIDSSSISNTTQHRFSFLDIASNSRFSISGQKSEQDNIYLDEILVPDGNGDFSLYDAISSIPNDCNQSLVDSLLGNIPTPFGPEPQNTQKSLTPSKTSYEIDGQAEILIYDFLLSILASSDEADLRKYSKSLFRLGFHPDCASSLELQFEDLSFMKLLHQRYFWKEWKHFL